MNEESKGEEIKTEEEIDRFEELRKVLASSVSSSKEESSKEAVVETDENFDKVPDVVSNSEEFHSQFYESTEDEEAGLKNRHLLEEEFEPDISSESSIEKPKTKHNSSLIRSILKPDGHLNKPLIGVIIFGSLFFVFVFLIPGSETENKVVAPKTKTLPVNSTDDLTGVTPGRVSETNSNLNTDQGDFSILGNTNFNSNSAIANANTNTNQPVGTGATTTTTSTYTTIEPQQTGVVQNNSGSVSTQVQNRETTGGGGGVTTATRKNVSQDFTVALEDDQSVRRNETVSNSTGNVNTASIETDVPVKQIRIQPGTKIQMVLREPFRSGIETKVQAVCTQNIKGTDGKVIIPSGSTFEFTFRPEEVGGRVLAKNVVRVILTDGSIGEVVGIVKGQDGFAGLSGKVLGGQNIGSRILGGVTRVGGRILGQTGGVGDEINTEVQINNNSNEANIYRSRRIVEVKEGTKFYLLIGTPE